MPGPLIGRAGRALASAIVLTRQSRPGQDVSVVNAAGGIGLPRCALFLPLVIVQLLRERG